MRRWEYIHSGKDYSWNHNLLRKKNNRWQIFAALLAYASVADL